MPSSPSWSYLRRLESGWEEAPWPPLLPLPMAPDNPLPAPADCRFPDKSFSTAARFPVRAASRSSCSFPIANPREKTLRRRGEEKEEGRGWGRLWEWKSSSVSLFSPLNPNLFHTVLPTAGSFLPDSQYRWRLQRGKLCPSRAAPAPSKLPLSSPPSLVRHFLETVLSFCSENLKTFSFTTHARAQTYTLSHTHTPSPNEDRCVCTSLSQSVLQK